MIHHFAREKTHELAVLFLMEPLIQEGRALVSYRIN
jgi:hypothetical protein